MKLSDGIEQYVARKRAIGFEFEHGESCLFRFLRRAGDVLLSQIRSQQVSAFLDGTVTSTITWRLKYQLLLRFFEYWSLRGMMPQLAMPPPRPLVRQTFVPYVLSRTQLRMLLRATIRNQEPRKLVDQQTLRTFLLLLYGTGALVGEVINLNIENVDLVHDLITIGRQSRQVPVGKDLREVLLRYVAWRSRKRLVNQKLFVTKDDLPASQDRIRKDFRELCIRVGIQRSDGVTNQIRLQDFRCTFAVHRITSWIRNGADLNRMLPALAAYMGQVGLGSTERYLQMTPERFRKNVNKLSPGRGNGHWRDNKALMEFLASL